MIFLIKRIGRYSLEFDGANITGYGSVGGKKEGEGPLSENFDKLIYDSYAGRKTYEQAENLFQQEAFELALNRGGKKTDVFSGRNKLDKYFKIKKLRADCPARSFYFTRKFFLLFYRRELPCIDYLFRRSSKPTYPRKQKHR